MTVGRTQYLAAAAIALAIAAVVTCAIASRGGSDTGSSAIATSADSRYGHPPKGLVIAEPTPVRTITATEQSPDKYAAEGYTVVTRLPSGRADVFVEGPAVPSWVATQAESGQFRLGETAPSTFQVRFSDVTGTIPVSAKAWTLVTGQGKVITPTASLPGGGALPTTLHAGQSLSFTLRTGLPETDGVIRWAPLGQRILVAWSWQLEYD